MTTVDEVALYSFALSTNILTGLMAQGVISHEQVIEIIENSMKSLTTSNQNEGAVDSLNKAITMLKELKSIFEGK